MTPCRSRLAHLLITSSSSSRAFNHPLEPVVAFRACHHLQSLLACTTRLFRPRACLPPHAELSASSELATATPPPMVGPASCSHPTDRPIDRHRIPRTFGLIGGRECQFAYISKNFLTYPTPAFDAGSLKRSFDEVFSFQDGAFSFQEMKRSKNWSIRYRSSQRQRYLMLAVVVTC